VRDALGAEHHAAVFEDADQRFVGFLEEHAGDRFDFGHEIAVKANAMHHRQAMLLPEGQIVDTVSRRRVHDAGATFGADEVAGVYLEGGVRIDVEIVEQPLVAGADQLAALNGFDDRVFLIAHDRLAQRLGQDQRLAVYIAIAVVDVSTNRERQV